MMIVHEREIGSSRQRQQPLRWKAVCCNGTMVRFDWISSPPHYSSVMPEPEGGHGPPFPIFGRSVNPIQNGGGQIIPTYYYWPPNAFHLPASLLVVTFNQPESFCLLLVTRRRTFVLNSTSSGQETSKKVPYTITEGLKWLAIDAIRILISHYPICNVLTDLNSQDRCVFCNMLTWLFTLWPLSIRSELPNFESV